MARTDSPDLASFYEDTRERLTALVSALDEPSLATPVPACPGWSVRDVTAHLAGVAEDVLDGKLTRPPSDEETAAQVARFRGRSEPEILEKLAELAPRFEDLIQQFEVWPAALDIAAHEQDIRGALAMPGGRDSEVILAGSEALIGWMQPPLPLRVVLEDDEIVVDPAGGGSTAAELVLRTTRYEAFRWRLGRRSRNQLVSLDWSGDPTAVLDHLAVFGPSPIDIFD